jgi:WD40 repeat protein
MPNRSLRRPARFLRVVGSLLPLISLWDVSAAPRPSPFAAPVQRVDTSPFLARTMPIGNLGSITCNPGRYAFNATWTLLAAPQDDGSVRLFDVATGGPLPPLEGGFKVGTFTYTYADGVPSAHFGFSADGSTVVWSWGKKIVVWDVASRSVLLRREVPGSSWGFDFSLFGGAELREKLVTAWPTPSSSGSGRPVESPDGRLMAYVNLNDDVEIRDARNASATRVLPGREKGKRGRCTVFHNTGTGRQLLFSRDGRILCDSCRVTDVWDLSEAVPRLVVRTGLLRDTAGRPVLSPDGRTLAYPWGSGSTLRGDGGFALVDVASARSVGPNIEIKYMGAMEFSPDSRQFATVGWVPTRGRKKDYEVQIWNVEALRSGAEVDPGRR